MNKRVLYFGTNGSQGHNLYPINCDVCIEEGQTIVKYIDSFAFENLFKEHLKSLTFVLTVKYTIMNGLSFTRNYFCYGVPFSPDDPRPGGRTVVMIEDGGFADMRQVFEESIVVRNQFRKVYVKYNFLPTDILFK